MSEQITKRKQQALNTRKKIYDVCIAMMLEKGYDKINISDVCEKVGISVGGFYHHFKSKEEIIIETYKIADEEAAKVIEQNSSTGTWSEKIIKIFEVQMNGIADTGVNLVTQLYKSQINENSGFLFSNDRVMPRVLTEIIKNAQIEGMITMEYSSEFIVRELLRFSRGIIYDWCAHGGAYDIVEDMRVSMSVYLRSFEIS